MSKQSLDLILDICEFYYHLNDNSSHVSFRYFMYKGIAIDSSLPTFDEHLAFPVVDVE